MNDITTPSRPVLLTQLIWFIGLGLCAFAIFALISARISGVSVGVGSLLSMAAGELIWAASAAVDGKRAIAVFDLVVCGLFIGFAVITAADGAVFPLAS